MAYRFKEQYGAVLKKREALRSAGAFSDPDEPGSRVSILVPFMEELVTEPQWDSRESFEGQTERLIEYYTAHDRIAEPIMDAKKEDFARILADTAVPTVVVAGFGNFSAVAVPLSHEQDQTFHYGYLDWLHLAGMATHLKLGRFVALQCGGYYRQFNPPLGAGVQISYQNIFSTPDGKGRFADGDWEAEVAPITTAQELSYEEIRERYPQQGDRGLPNFIHIAVRGVRSQLKNPHIPKLIHERGPNIPSPDRIPYPDEMRQFSQQ